MRKEILKNQWLLSYSPPFTLSDSSEQEAYKDFVSTPSECFPGAPMPNWARLEYRGDTILADQRRVSIYKNLEIDHLREDSKRTNRELDSFYAIYTGSDIHDQVKKHEGDRIWLSRIFLNEEQEVAIHFLLMTDEEKQQYSLVSLVSAIYTGKGAPVESRLTDSKIVQKYKRERLISF